MGRKDNYFRGVNKTCAQCLRKCKQFENVILVNCPLYKPRKRISGSTIKHGNRSRIPKLRDTSGERGNPIPTLVESRYSASREGVVR